MNEHKILETFGLNFKMYRTKLRMSQDEVASRTGLSKPYISNIENGKHSISLVNALMLSELVGKNIESMLREFD